MTDTTQPPQEEMPAPVPAPAPQSEQPVQQEPVSAPPLPQPSSEVVLRTLSEVALADSSAARGRLNAHYATAIQRLTEQFEAEKKRLTEQRDAFDANLVAAVDDIIAFEADAVKAMDVFLEAAKSASVKSVELIPPVPPPAQQFVQGRPPLKLLERPVDELESDIARTAATLRRPIPRAATPGNGLIYALLAITLAAVAGAAFIANRMG